MGKGGGGMITEQEAWDEYKKLMDLQEKSILHQSKGIESSKINDCKLVTDFVTRMKEAGFLYLENKRLGVTNWFFSCNGRLFVISQDSSGFLELRWR
jgi:hypothetical protein